MKISFDYKAVLNTSNNPKRQRRTIGGLTSGSNSGKTERIMSRWKVGLSTVFILASLIFIMLLIVVLPDVDLDDMAFHQGTAPLVVHAKATTAPATIAVATVFSLHNPETASPFRNAEVLAAHLDPNFRPILLRSIRC